MYAIFVANGGRKAILLVFHYLVGHDGCQRLRESIVGLVRCSVGSACVCVYAVIKGISFYLNAVAICPIALASLEGGRSLFFQWSRHG